MGSARWIGGFLGWVAWGPIGALIGYLLGSALESVIDVSRQIPGGNDGPFQGGGYGRNTGGYGTGTGGYGRTTGTGGYGTGTGGYGTGGYGRSTGGYTADEQRNSFFVSLLVLSSAVIKADGNVHPAELQTVKEFFRRNFGDQAATQASQILDKLNATQVNIYSVGDQIASNMNYSQRLQLFHYLVSIANADGDFSKSEKSVLEAIGSVIRLNSSDISSVIAMTYRDKDSAYAVLEISPNATDDEVKAAYRKMAMKHHPDKVSTLGPEVQKAAQEKFRKIQEAYETIKKERGMK
ncbi:MAG: TerB family tellurite resistance protein [Bacteroidales bacterium]|nr:TerB family tellurite resistance protein [Bacteroidales bacterium]